MLRILAALCVCATTVICIAPPHPDFEDEYRRQRRRLKASKNYTMPPKLEKLSPELCHGLSDDECRRLDVNYVSYTGKARTLIKTRGRIKPLVLLLQFSDHLDRERPSKADVEALWNAAEGESLDLLPTGSIREFLRRNSYDNLILEADVMNWTVTDNTELHYSFNVSGTALDLAASMYPVLQAIETLGTNFSKYDLDNDGVIDALVVLHSGFAAEIGGFDCYNSRGPEQRIWAHSIGSSDDKWTSRDGRYTLGVYMFASALRGTCGSDLARLGIITHEFVHTWGIPDIYDTAGDWIGKGVGTFDIMSNPYGLDGAQTHPNNLGPWVKMQSGWLEPIEITKDGEYFIEASAINPNVYVLEKKFPTGEYIIIENRQPIGWDSLLWGGGLLIWHIDDNVEGNDQRGYPGQFGWPGNGKHYRVALACADRKFDLEKGNNNGDEYDFWIAGSEFSPGLFEFEATDFLRYPNTNSYVRGSIFPTGIRVYDISQSGTVMSFKIEGVSSAAPTPSPAPSLLFNWPSVVSPTKKNASQHIKLSRSPLPLPSMAPSTLLVPTQKPDPETIVISSPSPPISPSQMVRIPPSNADMTSPTPSAATMLSAIFAISICLCICLSL